MTIEANETPVRTYRVRVELHERGAAQLRHETGRGWHEYMTVEEEVDAASIDEALEEAAEDFGTPVAFQVPGSRTWISVTEYDVAERMADATGRRGGRMTYRVEKIGALPYRVVYGVVAFQNLDGRWTGCSGIDVRNLDDARRVLRLFEEDAARVATDEAQTTAEAHPL